MNFKICQQTKTNLTHLKLLLSVLHCGKLLQSQSFFTFYGYARKTIYVQRILTEGEGSVRLTSSLRYVVL
jgi:hypothetical protein